MKIFSFFSSYLKNILFISLFLLTPSYIHATATFTEGSSATELATQLEGIGITITNPQLTFGANTQRGIFSNGINGAGLEIDEGIILTTMSVEESFSTNNSTGFSVNNADNDDADLLGIDTNARFNTIVFEFDVTLDANTRLLLIDYQFASEEYPEFVGSRYNDAFGFFISGGDLPNGVVYNIARVVDNNTYVTINNIDDYPVVVVNNVNIGVVGIHDDATPEDLNNSAFFIDNNQNNVGGHSPVTIEYDGLTRTLNATLDNLTPGETYHFKMAIADTSDSLLNTGVFVNKINGLTEPSICYDYAYKQDGLFLTEGYDANKGPFISADVSTNSPLEVAMFFMNTKISEITASNITVNILDINTSQATYNTESVWVTEPNNAFKTKINDSDLNVSNSYIYDIPITSFDSFEYFYTYFSLDPIVNTLSLPIIARIDYDLIIPLSLTISKTIKRSSLIDTEIPICGGGSSTYDPVYGIFNIIENDLYTDPSNYFYNLNTQVTNREASLSIASVDGNLTSNADLHTLTNNITTVIGVDMLDLKSFHYTGASCGEIDNSISDRAWIIVDQNYITPLITNDLTFYETARENVSFRMSYNVNADDGDLIQLEKVTNGSDDRWNILNFSNAVKLGNCTPNIGGTIAQVCTNAGEGYNSAMTPVELAECMECVHGINTKLLCARDNFSIRPEAFLIQLDDQDQNNTAIKKRITNNFSGVVAPTVTQLDIAAGYRYSLEINATNHLNNQASIGYNVHLNTITGTNSGYYWEPGVSIIATNCNDTIDTLFTTILINGEAEMNTSISQVGEYSLKFLDTSWTKIDSVQQPHQAGTYFSQNSDCVLGSTNVENVGAPDHLNGCNISSNHDSSSDTNLKYRNLNLSVHPYKFDMSGITLYHGIENNTAFDGNISIYMADITSNSYQDQNMSFHLNGPISALGKNNSILSNFVDGCYAKDINLTIMTSNIKLSSAADHRYVFHNTDNALRTESGSMDDNLTINLNTTDFNRSNNGTVNTILNLNFDRNASGAQNPETLTFTNYKVACSDPVNDCQMNAQLDDKFQTEGNKDLNQTGLNTNTNITINYLYGRSHAERNFFPAPANQIAFIYYETYCDGTIGGNTCRKGLLPNGIDSNTTDDPRWFINTNHTSNHGTAGNVNQKGSAAYVTQVDAPTGNHQDDVNITYDGTKGFPYKTTMQMNSSNWLIYNKYNDAAIVNEFKIEYAPDATSWGGKAETNSTTRGNAAGITNRRFMW